MHHVSFLGEIYQKTRHGKSAKRQRPIASSKSLLRALCCAFFRSAVKKLTNSKTKIDKNKTKNQKPAQKQKTGFWRGKTPQARAKTGFWRGKTEICQSKKLLKIAKSEQKRKKTHTKNVYAHPSRERLGGFRASLCATSANIDRRLGVQSPTWSGKCELLW